MPAVSDFKRLHHTGCFCGEKKCNRGAHRCPKAQAFVMAELRFCTSVSGIFKMRGTLRGLDRPAEGYRKKVTCDYTAAA